ncbi:hypothetical protein D3C75_1031040 [compost metagenome]
MPENQGVEQGGQRVALLGGEQQRHDNHHRRDFHQPGDVVTGVEAGIHQNQQQEQRAAF